MSCSFCGFVIISQSEIGILERFGKFVQFLNPGFHCINPFTTCMSGTVTLRVNQIEIKTETKTKDNVFVSLKIIVNIKVDEDNIKDAYYKLQDVPRQIRGLVENSVRGIIAHIDMDKAFENKDTIGNQIKLDIANEMKNYGYLIISVLITDIEPEKKVKDAMNDINASKRLKEATQEKAEAERIRLLMEAETNKIRIVKQAEAEAEAKHLQGVGVSRQREAILEGYRKGIHELGESLSIDSKDAMMLTLTTQYFDMLRDVGQHGSVTFIPHYPSAVGDFTEQLRNAVLQTKSTYTQVTSSHTNTQI